MMRRKKYLALLLVVSFFLLSFSVLPLRAQAAVIFEQLPGEINLYGYISSTLGLDGSVPGYRAADDFALNADSVVNDIHWWGEPVSGVRNDYAFTFTFYSDDGGIPGSVIHTSIGSLDISDGVSYPIGSEFYSSVLTSPFSATAGVTYWLSIFDASSYADAQFLWFSSDASFGAFGQHTPEPPGNSWDTVYNLAFQLTNDESSVPEPSTMLLVGVGLAGVGLFRKRFKG